MMSLVMAQTQWNDKMTTIIDKTLYNDVFATIAHTIAQSRDRGDLWKLTIELTTEMTAFVQRRHKSNSPTKKTETVSEPETVPCDGPDVDNAPPVPAQDPENTAPLWLSKQITWADYWVYQYSNPVSTLHGHCGEKCVQTELWLVHRRTGRGLFVDAEFANTDAVKDFLDPRVELAKADNIYPLDQIDAELAGGGSDDDTPKKSRDCGALTRFVAAYKKYGGDTDQIMAEMGFASKQSVYSYKNKAKSQGLL